MDGSKDQDQAELHIGDGAVSLRTRRLTEKGNEAYLVRYEHLHRVVEEAWRNVEIYISTLSSSENIVETEHTLTSLYTVFCAASEKLVDFLSSTRTERSMMDLEMFHPVMTSRRMKVDSIYRTLKRSDGDERGSRTSRTRSNYTSKSSASSLLARSRAKAEAAKARAKIVQEEVELRKKQASLQADLDLLSVKKEVAAAEAELKVFESEHSSKHSSRSSLLSGLPDNIDNPMQRTAAYVERHSSRDNDNSSDIPAQDNASETPKRPSDFCVAQDPEPTSGEVKPPTVTQSSNIGTCSMTTLTSDLTRFMLRKDLLFSRLSNFNDRPESYCSWKFSFKNVMRELQVLDSEEMDLLLKYLGPESRKHAESIRSSNLNNMKEGLCRLWQRLDERYGAPEMVETAIKNRVVTFPKLSNKDSAKLYDLADLLAEMMFLKEDPTYQTLFSYLDSSSGVKPIISKLPYFLQEKWTMRAARYKKEKNTVFPPFKEFVEFIREISRIRNDPSFAYDYVLDKPSATVKTRSFTARKTNVNEESTSVKNVPKCPIHTMEPVNHNLLTCRKFKSKPLSERKKLLKQQKLCFRCALSDHRKENCKIKLKCDDCGSAYHPTALHPSQREEGSQGVQQDGGETTIKQVVTTKCTEICKGMFEGKSCARILPVKVLYGDMYIDTYALLDDQSNRTLARKELFDRLGIISDPIEYRLNSCSGQVMFYGRTGVGLGIESIDGQTQMSLPTVIECDNLPDSYSEIPTPEAVSYHPHLKDIAQYIMPIDRSRQILILVGRDLIQAHHILEQRIGPPEAPFAQKTPFGWTVIGEMCLDGQHIPKTASTYRTYISSGIRASILEPCPQSLKVKENVHGNLASGEDISYSLKLFECTVDDNKVGTSVDDRVFLDIMENNMILGEEGRWIAPLPFRLQRSCLPNNYKQALRRAHSLDTSLRKDPRKRDHFLIFMKKLFENDHVEVAPPILTDTERWYLPLFGVYHPRKPDQIRGVFDSSARENGISLNDVLLSGPDMTNDLLGVLLRFRKQSIGVIGDIQHMFHCFLVEKKHRDFLRFLWYRNNDMANELIEHRMKVHVFGNRPSPAVANYGLLKAAMLAGKSHGPEVQQFISQSFYVDDGLTSCSTSEEAINLLRATQSALMEHGRLRLHKFASNSVEVMNALNPQDLAQNMHDLDLEKDQPMQRSLGLVWNLSLDSFIFNVSTEVKPVSRRGVLSTINSLYDPLGFLSPVTIVGKLILRKVVAQTTDWDEPLPSDLEMEWRNWKNSLVDLEQVFVPRVMVSDLDDTTRKELLVFSDASEQAISAVSYIRAFYKDGKSQTGFILGKAKVAPVSGHTVPRLELCAAVLAVEVQQLVAEHIKMKFDAVRFFTDSRVVLGYICNDSRRFFVYVSNRVARIRHVTESNQWNYVPSNLNPADIGTRGVNAREIQGSTWLNGPDETFIIKDIDQTIHPLVNPSEDTEIKASCMKSEVLQLEPVSHSPFEIMFFQRFSKWSKLVNVITMVLRFISACRRKSSDRPLMETMLNLRQTAEKLIIQAVQEEVYTEELECLRSSQPLHRSSKILSLDPFLGNDGLLHVGGRLARMDSDTCFRNPVILPGYHYVSKLIIHSCHEEVAHQGRHFTEGKVRSNGFWITGCKRIVSSLIHKCITCKKLRGRLEVQKMSNLPIDRITPGQPPFTCIGIDMFGPWQIVTRRTRGGSANSKRWAAMFTCLVTRAVHVEVTEEMSASSFINALRRLVAIRGKVREIRSDRGSNFIGAADLLSVDSINVEDGSVRNFLYKSGIVWRFNPPHSSHMGGVWERMIGVTRRILDSMLLQNAAGRLTHEVLVTFLAEASAIINARPLIPVSTDPNMPYILTPSLLLTQKSDAVDDVQCDEDPKDLLRSQWKRVQHLARIFWKRWRNEYLPLLQPRKKWCQEQQNICAGDVVLLKDKELKRNEWPMGIITQTFPSDDNLVRKVQVRVMREEKPVLYTRPIADLVLLVRQ